MAKKLTSLFASMMLFISNGAQAKPKNFEQSLKIENNKNVGNSLKIDNNRSKKTNNNLTTKDWVTYLFETLVLGGGLYYGVPYCRELYRKYFPICKLNSIYEPILGEDEVNPKVLGKGGQGEAWLFKNRETDKLVVVKKITGGEDVQKCEKLAYDNREMLSACEYFCRPLDFFEEDGVAYVVYEYIESVGYDQFNNIVQNSEKGANLLLCMIVVQILEALKYLNDKGFSHNDVTRMNILLIRDEQGNPKVKIIDYGRFKNEVKNATSQIFYFVQFLANNTCSVNSVLSLYGINSHKPLQVWWDFSYFKNQKPLDGHSYDETINFFKDEIKKFGGEVHK